MNQEALNSLKAWFRGYCGAFSTSVAEDQRNIDLKRDHTKQVCLNAVRIAEDLKWDQHQTVLAETVALFHDIGRFPQYRQYKTFDDSISVNHAALGAKALLEHNVLRNQSQREQDIIIRSVTLHNVFSLPEGLDDDVLLFTKLVRDADKLDILRVTIEYFGQDAGRRAEAIALGLPDAPGYSPGVLSCLRRGKMARKDALTTLNDFKLLQLAWLYDLNFTSSLRMVLERDYIRALAEKLPKNDEIAAAIELVGDYVNRRLQAAELADPGPARSR